MILQILIGSACALVFAATLAVYGIFSTSIIAYSMAVWAVMCMYINRYKAVLLTGAISVATLVVWGVVSISGIAQKNAVSPEQYLAEYNRDLAVYAFTPDTNMEMNLKAGELARADKTIEPVSRDITFATDSNGLRNNHDLREGDIILLGGPFISGVGNSQDSLVSSILEKKYSVGAYNVASNGTLDEQVLLLRTITKNSTGKNKVILFLFEGEDFKSFSTEIHYPFRRFVTSLSNSELGRLFRIYAGTKPVSNVEEVVSYPIGDKSIAFSKKYVDETMRQDVELDPKLSMLLKSMQDVVQAVVFVPTKFRVYTQLITEDIPQSHNSAHWEQLRNLCESIGIPAYDLTPHLQAEAVQKWGQDNSVIWWQDDIYWNKSGAQVAAQLVHDIVNGNL